MPEETEKPTVTLSEEESRMTQRLLRASRRDVEQVVIDAEGNQVSIKLFALAKIHLDLDKALEMDDDAWKTFFFEHPPLI